MGTKILSVIVPTYNMERYLDRCLSSLIIGGENMSLLEILVVNDGSRDSSSEIAHRYETKYPDTFRVIDKENGNYGSCINAALPVASGKYVKVLDADDWFSDNLGEYISFLQTVDSDLVLSAFDWAHDDGTVIKSTMYELPADKDLPVSFLLSCEEMWMHAVTYRTENLRQINYRQSEGISYTDQEWIFMPMKAVRTIRYYDKVVYKYLQGREGQTVALNVWLAHSEQEIQGARVMLEQYRQYGSEVSSEIRRYWEMRIRQRSELIYQRILLSDIDLDSGRCSLGKYDEELMAACPDLYNEFNDAEVSPKIKYRYIENWRLDKSHRTVRLKVVILEKRLRNLVLKVTGK